MKTLVIVLGMLLTATALQLADTVQSLFGLRPEPVPADATYVQKPDNYFVANKFRRAILANPQPAVTAYIEPAVHFFDHKAPDNRPEHYNRLMALPPENVVQIKKMQNKEDS